MCRSQSRVLAFRRFRWAVACLIAIGATAVFGTTVVIVVPVKAKGSGPLYRIRENGKWGYMDRRGSVVIPAQFEHAEDFFEHKAVVSLEAKTGYIDEAGKWQIEPKFLSAGCFKGGVAVAGSLGAQGLIDSTGRFLIDPQFETIEDFSEGLAAAKEEQLWGYINKTGRWVIQLRFAEA